MIDVAAALNELYVDDYYDYNKLFIIPFILAQLSAIASQHIIYIYRTIYMNEGDMKIRPQIKQSNQSNISEMQLISKAVIITHYR